MIYMLTRAFNLKVKFDYILLISFDIKIKIENGE